MNLKEQELLITRILGYEKLPFPAVPKYQKPGPNGVIGLYYAPAFDVDLNAAFELVYALEERDWYAPVLTHLGVQEDGSCPWVFEMSRRIGTGTWKQQHAGETPALAVYNFMLDVAGKP